MHKPVGHYRNDKLVVAWNNQATIAHGYAITHETAYPRTTEAVDPVKKEEYLWVPGGAKPDQLWFHKVNGLALTANAALCAGSIVTGSKQNAGKGFLCVLSLTDGKVLSKIILDCPPTDDGLAVAGEQVFLSLQNGILVCLGK